MLSDIIYHLILLNSFRSDKKDTCPYMFCIITARFILILILQEKKDTCLQRSYTRVHIPSRSQKEKRKLKQSIPHVLTIFIHSVRSFRCGRSSLSLLRLCTVIH